MILRRNREGPFQVSLWSALLARPGRGGAGLATDRPLPGGRSASSSGRPCPVYRSATSVPIDGLFSLPEGQRLIVLAGTEQRLSSADQSKLGLEAIHPGRSGILDAYATVRHQLSRR